MRSTRFAAGLAAVVQLAFAAPAIGAVPAWTTYHHDAARSGIDPDGSAPNGPPSLLWQTMPALDGPIYGQPLIYGSRVYVATENDSVYALDAATGAIVWQRSAGRAVPAGQLPCGNISPTVGITGTPVIDPATGRIFVVADTWDGSHTASIAHHLVSFGLVNGDSTSPVVVDAPGSTPAAQLQRTALALDGKEIVIGYGGNDGDCGNYHGALVAIAENGSGPLLSYVADAAQNGDHGGAIWGAGNGPAVDSNGNIFAATGNGYTNGTYDGSESVIKLDPSLNLLDHYAPANWLSLDQSDADIGSSEPLLLPGGLVFQIGKAGVGYLLSAGNLGGTGVPGNPPTDPSLFHANVCPGSYGGGVYAAGVIYVGCSDGLHALLLNASAHSFGALPGWKIPTAAVGPPIIAGGLVWDVGWTSGHLFGLDPASGTVKSDTQLGTFTHFSSPSAGGGRLFVSAGNNVAALRIANPPSPATTTTSLGSGPNPSPPGGAVTLTARVTPAPDAGTVAFFQDGVPVAGCAPVSMGLAAGVASCQTSYAQAGSHAVSASYSGDAYYGPSQSGALNQIVAAPSSPIAPGNTAVPVIRGVTKRGRTLTSSTGRWTANPTSYRYRWQRCDALGRRCSAIAGAEHPAYRLGRSDVAHTMRVLVSAANPAGSSFATSAKTRAVAADTPPPKLSRVRLRRSRFTAARGTTLTLTLSERAKVTLLITQSASGRTVGKRCAAHAVRGRRCRLTVQRAKLTFTGGHGHDAFTFHAWALARGRYRLTITARDASGDGSRPSRLAFDVT